MSAETHTILNSAGVEIITLVKSGDGYDIMVIDFRERNNLYKVTDTPFFVYDEVKNRLNIVAMSLDRVIDFIVRNFPRLKYRPEFKFKPEETDPNVMDFVWMSDRVYEGNVELSKRQPNMYGWLPVDEKDVIDLKLFGKDVTFLKPTIRPLTSTHFNLTLMDTVLVVGNHGKKIKPGASPLASCEVIFRVFGDDPDLNYFKASLYTVEDIENGIFGFNYHLVLTGPDDFACNTLNCMLDASQHAEDEEESIISKFLEYVTR